MDLILKLHSFKAIHGDVMMYVFDTGFEDAFEIKDVVADSTDNPEGYIVI